MPLFHAAGIYVFINAVIYYGTPIALSVERPLSSDLVMDSLNHVDADSTMLPPAILEDLSQTATGIEALTKLKFVAFGGGMLIDRCLTTKRDREINYFPGNLAREAGNRLVQNGVKLLNGIAATE